jgi:membrane fusion protein (multidrug efflux system)
MESVLRPGLSATVEVHLADGTRASSGH